MFDPNSQSSSPDEGSAIGGGTTLAGDAADAQPAPRVVTTGRKKIKPLAVDEETGERMEIFATNRGVSVVRYLDSLDTAPVGAALVDAMAFSVVPPEEKSYVWVLEQMAQFLDLGTIEQRKGLFGFRYSARFGDGAGMVAWGGESQKGRVYFSLMGKGCSMIQDWASVAVWLERNRAVIKRADLAYDDMEGRLVNIAWAVEQYKGEGFNAGGRKPRHTLFGDWLEGEDSTLGRTLGIGNRASGKYARIYEKGKQLGEAVSPWTRVEVEWRAQDRHIPYDILTRPGHYLAGAYPCLAFLTEEQLAIKTVSKGAQIAYDRVVENLKRSGGRAVNLMLDVLGGDYAGVVQALIRDGYPARVDPFSYHVRKNPTMLDREIGATS
jgi:phage replication initiation protein